MLLLTETILSDAFEASVILLRGMSEKHERMCRCVFALYICNM